MGSSNGKSPEERGGGGIGQREAQASYDYYVKTFGLEAARVINWKRFRQGYKNISKSPDVGPLRKESEIDDDLERVWLQFRQLLEKKGVVAPVTEEIFDFIKHGDPPARGGPIADQPTETEKGWASFLPMGANGKTRGFVWLPTNTHRNHPLYLAYLEWTRKSGSSHHGSAMDRIHVAHDKQVITARERDKMLKRSDREHQEHFNHPRPLLKAIEEREDAAEDKPGELQA